MVYSFGCNGQTDFEEELIKMTETKCEVHVFDFTLPPEVAERVQSIERVTFHNYGIGSVDSTISEEYAFGSHVVSGYQLNTLPTIMKQLGHRWVDLLKIDVEGAEYEVLPSILSHYQAVGQQVPVTQAQVEYHHWPNKPPAETLVATLKAMETSGFRAFHTEFNYNGPAWHFIEYAYLQVNADGKVVHPSINSCR